MEGGGSNTFVVDLKSFTDVTVWVQSNLPSDAPKFEHCIYLDILAGIFQIEVSSEEVRNNEVHGERVKRSANKYVVVTSFQRNSP